MDGNKRREKIEKRINHEDRLEKLLDSVNSALDLRDIRNAEEYLTQFEDLYETTGYKREIDSKYASTKQRYFASLGSRR